MSSKEHPVWLQTKSQKKLLIFFFLERNDNFCLSLFCTCNHENDEKKLRRCFNKTLEEKIEINTVEKEIKTHDLCLFAS